MKILSFKPGHDGTVAFVDGGKLRFSIEAEKDNWPRYAEIPPTLFLRSLELADAAPDVFALSGWVKGFHSVSDPVGSGYFGADVGTVIDRPQRLMGQDIRFFSSSHERSHLMGVYGMSPFPQGQPCYVLVWEGNIGAFYHIDEAVRVTKIGDVLEDPGNKYAFLYALADPSFPLGKGQFRFEDAGKLMALAGYGEAGPATKEEQKLIDFVLSCRSILLRVDKRELGDSPFFNAGVESQPFKNLARRFSDALFERFADFARKHLTAGLPLLVAGGCGLNCDWNTHWERLGLFEDVFVPPCANDSGSAIGTAVDALRHYTGQAKIDWTVYAGEEFVLDDADLAGVVAAPLDLAEMAHRLSEGAVLAWVQGRYEIGPRALGNRSLLAMPFTREMHARLNRIKQREGFRPIAPVCLEEDVPHHFDSRGPSPYMLFFQNVRSENLKAVTHVDGSARIQSVNAGQNPRLHALLTAFKRRTGCGVLCNTSLNYKGMGFINHLSDLVDYAREVGLDGFVVGDTSYTFATKSAG